MNSSADEFEPSNELLENDGGVVIATPDLDAGASLSVTSKFIWTTAIYVASVAVRFSTSIVLSRILTPDILGVMVLANAVRTGAELLADIGLEQNVIHSPDGEEPRFLNTVWTIQLSRGLALSVACLGLSPFLSYIYNVPLAILMTISAAPLVNSLSSTSVFTLSKRVKVKARNLFELYAEILGLIINVSLALIFETVWAPVLGVLLTLSVRALISYALPHQVHKFVLDRKYAHSIAKFGKWITLSSIAFYASLYTDRLFFAGAVDIATLGVYGLARTISDLPPQLAHRLGYLIVFPLIAAGKQGSRGFVKSDLASTRWRFLLLGAVGIATAIAWSDRVVMILYDQRYHDAGWMLSPLLLASWLGVLTSFSEAAIFGGGKPHIATVASVLRIVVMAAALPLGFAWLGLAGAILALPAAEMVRYLVLLIGQQKLGTSFALQDCAVSLALVGVLVSWLVVRQGLGLGTPWGH